MAKRKIDAHGRLSLGKHILEDLGIKPGTYIHVSLIEGGRALRLSAYPMPEESSNRSEEAKLISALVQALEQIKEGESK